MCVEVREGATRVRQVRTDAGEQKTIIGKIGMPERATHITAVSLGFLITQKNIKMKVLLKICSAFAFKLRLN